MSLPAWSSKAVWTVAAKLAASRSAPLKVTDTLGAIAVLHPDLARLCGLPEHADPPAHLAASQVRLSQPMQQFIHDLRRDPAKLSPLELLLELAQHDATRHTQAGDGTLADLEPRIRFVNDEIAEREPHEKRLERLVRERRHHAVRANIRRRD